VPGAPRPENVTVATRKVSYQLMSLESTTVQYGFMIVQMLTDSQIKIEVFAGSQAATAEFDAQAMVFVW
jgi:hypothetical protein